MYSIYVIRKNKNDTTTQTTKNMPLSFSPKNLSNPTPSPTAGTSTLKRSKISNQPGLPQPNPSPTLRLSQPSTEYRLITNLIS